MNDKQFRQKARKMIKQSDLLHKGFLKPMQMVLKTSKTDRSGNIKQGQLPKGLKIALKKGGISSNNYQLFDINTFPQEQQQRNMQYDDFISNNYNNLFSIIKSFNEIEIAICICMYSEEKKMLKNTLAGIGQNIEKIVKRNGINPDKIATFIIMDGIEHVHHSVVQYIQDLQRESQMYFNDDTQSLKMSNIMNNQNYNIFGEPNINNLLFDPYEMEQRKSCRFINRKSQYEQFKLLQKKISKWKNDKTLTYDQLQPRIQKFFLDAARKELKTEYSLRDDEVESCTEQKLLYKYAMNQTKARPIIISALRKAQIYCEEYINKREDLAYVSVYRTSVLLEQNSYEQDRNLNKDGHQSLINEEEEELVQKQIKMNLFFFAKYRNSGKLSSHNWFFNGFCQQLNPKYALLIDVGLRPEAQALYKMYNCLVNNPKVGGVCGYMSLKTQKLEDQDKNYENLIDFVSSIILKIVDIQRAQQIQYHFSHLIDKPFQASFGFIHVLPGAFSGYNLEALKKNYDYQLFKEYFKSISDKIDEGMTKESTFTGLEIVLRILFPQVLYKCLFGEIDEKSQQQLLYDENIYLAQDRILCMGIHKNGLDITFLPDAYAWVDPIKTIHGLLGQRKRWINGSYFAFEKVKKQLFKNEKCELGLIIQIVYLTFMNLLAYVAPALFLFTISIAMQAFKADFIIKQFGNESFLAYLFVPTINFIYVIMIMGMIFFSLHLTNRDYKFIPYIYVIASFLGLFAKIVFIVLAIDIFRGFSENSEFLFNQQQLNQILWGHGKIIFLVFRYMVIAIIILYFIPTIIYTLFYKNQGFLTELMYGTISFLFFGPTYLNMLNIYALCRIDDISWGTKGLDQETGGKNDKLKETWKIVKYIHVGKFLFWNTLTGAILLSLSSSQQFRFYVTFLIMSLLFISLFIKVMISVIYLIIKSCSSINFTPNKNNLHLESQVDIFLKKINPQLRKVVEENIDEATKNSQIQNKQDKDCIYFNKRKQGLMKKYYTKNQNSYLNIVSKYSQIPRKNLNKLKNQKLLNQKLKKQPQKVIVEESNSRNSFCGLKYQFQRSQQQKLRKKSKSKKSKKYAVQNVL